MSTNPTYTNMYQSHPIYEKPSHFPPKGWTETVVGYIREARKWVYAVLQNGSLMVQPYKWVVHVNLNCHILPKDVGPMWSKVCRSLKRQGINAIWVREVNRSNKMHYHIIVKNIITKKNLKKAIKTAMPLKSVLRWRCRAERIKRLHRLVNYVFKAKVCGLDGLGRWVDDMHASKRLLFNANMPFNKVGTIGDFWENGMSVLRFWDQLKAIEEKKKNGLMDCDVRHLCQYVYDFLGGHVSRAKIEHEIGLNSDSPVFQDWIARLKQEGWADDYWRPGAGEGRPQCGRAI